MNPLVRTLYAAVGQSARLAAALAPDGSGKLRRALRARRGVRARWTGWASQHRDPRARCSGCTRRASARGCRRARCSSWRARERPELQLAYTFYSPSAERFARGARRDGRRRRLPAVRHGRRRRRAARGAAPSRARVQQARRVAGARRAGARRRVPLGLVSATLAAGSSRRGRLAGGAPARRLRAPRRGGRDRATTTPSGSSRSACAGPRARHRRHALRPGVARARAERRRPAARRAARAAGAGAIGRVRFTLVAGSTWPADERALLEAWQTCGAQDPRARLVLAPHEPTEAHLAPLERGRATQRRARAPVRDSRRARPPGDADVVLVDRVGVLAELYAAATRRSSAAASTTRGCTRCSSRPPSASRWPSARSTPTAATPACCSPPAGRAPRRRRARWPSCCGAGARATRCAARRRAARRRAGGARRRRARLDARRLQPAVRGPHAHPSASTMP
jgi:3-deoxy-D-manno-octulosonic-acid transferase